MPRPRGWQGALSSANDLFRQSARERREVLLASVTGISQGYPTISQREAETSATVRDGDSFVIGGLTQEDFISTKGKIPGLGDIPLLGNLFHNDRRTSARTELYIVVTPHIVRRVGLTSPAANAPPPGNGVQY